jgi:hypothetical protein
LDLYPLLSFQNRLKILLLISTENGELTEYYGEYIPNSDFNEYPEFSINGMGISVIINE